MSVLSRPQLEVLTSHHEARANTQTALCARMRTNTQTHPHTWPLPSRCVPCARTNTHTHTHTPGHFLPAASLGWRGQWQLGAAPPW